MSLLRLHHLLSASARRAPDAPAVDSVSYAQLDQWANQVAHRLRAADIQPGDRVAVRAAKSARAVAALQGVLRAGAAYVPIDPASPAERATKIVHDCAARVVITDAWLDDLARYPDTSVPDPERAADDLAYILYTSGSTGTPKGVCLSHRNALAFVEWAAAELAARPDDRFANHAPFHFDLSVLDLYVPFLVGASVQLVPPETAYAPKLLVEFLLERDITVWYSVPSALVLMIREGGLLDRSPGPDSGPGRLRALLFAGEVFPPPYLGRLRAAFPELRMLNLYGPTETNVCTFHTVRDVGSAPVPIGRACSGNRVWARGPDGSVAAAGEVGELIVDGPTVSLGYWGRAPQRGPYATGDLVLVGDDGEYEFVGRQDAMVKIRGFRVEPGEVEAALYAHPKIADVAVAAVGTGLETRLVAFLVAAEPEPPSLLEVKRHCAALLPRHMIVDEVVTVAALPQTANGKLDRLRLTGLAAEREVGHGTI